MNRIPVALERRSAGADRAAVARAALRMFDAAGLPYEQLARLVDAATVP